MIVADAVTTHVTLLQRLSSGDDPVAWQEFCDRYGLLLRNFARHHQLQPADCDEVVQDVLLALTRSMPGFRYDPAKGRFRAYLKKVVIHAIYRKFSQKPGEGDLQLGDESVRTDAVGDEAWECEWRQYHLRQAMSTVSAEFSEQDLQAFDQYAILGRDARETAAALGLNANQVYQAKSRILKRLGEIIARQVEEEG
jgi:RNA polymerase sigma-70 factor (ECF subfamily)